MTPEEFAQAANVSRETLRKFVLYQELLEKWQPRINLVGASTLPDLWARHFHDSAQLYPLLPPGKSRLADLGSGAGFPGLVLALLATDGKTKLETHLIESDKRKAAFLAEAARVTGLARQVAIHSERIQRVSARFPHGFDVITGRALAPLDELLTLAAPLLAPGGVCLFPKGEKAGAELTRARKSWKMAVEQFPSQTDPAGTIFRIKDLESGGK